jgi:uncharacterized membrane protein
MTDSEATRPKKRKVTRFLLAGFATLLPVVLTGYIIFALYRFVDTNLGRWLALALANALKPVWPAVTWTTPAIRAAGDILAVVIVLGAAFLVGALAGSFIGRSIIRRGEQLLLKVPFIKIVYPYIKQVTDFVLSEKKAAFSRVVAVPYPREGLYSLGFVTGDGWRTIREKTGQDMVQVFIPSSPTPVTGYVAFVRRDELIELPITVDQALRFSISGGVIVPPKEVIEAAVEARGRKELVAPEKPAWAEEE